MTSSDAASPEPPKPHRLGVLFVHGIGEQPRGGTLREVVDPIVRSLDLWLHGAARCRADVLGQAGASAWAQGVPAGIGSAQSETRFREKAHEMAWSTEWSLNPPTEAQKAQIRESAFWSGAAVLTDGVGTTDGEAPPHALLHVHTMGEHHDAREGTALIAECWWARAFVPATPWTLIVWTFKVLPFAIGMHFGDVVRRRLTGAADKSARPTRRVWHALLALVAFLSMLAVVALLAPLVLTLLLLISVLSLVPIGAVREAVISIQSGILGALGDSCLLVDSPVSRAMIVGRCKRDLQWLRERCEQLMVVAHSQGCAVSYQALSEEPSEELREVTWIGSGLRKLEALRDADRDSTVIWAGWFVALMPWLLWTQVAAYLDAGFSEGMVLVSVLALAAYVFGIARLILILRVGVTAVRLSAWHAQGVRITEVYATNDPVPQGPMFDMTSQHHFPLPAQEVHNRASSLRDHTSYWRNIEQVILPLGLKIAAAIGVPVDRLLASDTRFLELAVKRRIHRVRALVGLRSLALLGSLAILWIEAGTLTDAGDTLLAWAKSLVSPTQGYDQTVTQALLSCVSLLAWIVLPYTALVAAWRGWEVHEQRCFLLRAPPGTFLEWLLVGVMVTASAVPAGRSAALLWGDVGAETASVVIVVGAMFSAISYVLLSKVPLRAFGFHEGKG